MADEPIPGQTGLEDEPPAPAPEPDQEPSHEPIDEPPDPPASDGA
jgi:hypothetical protein